MRIHLAHACPGLCTWPRSLSRPSPTYGQGNEGKQQPPYLKSLQVDLGVGIRQLLDGLIQTSQAGCILPIPRLAALAAHEASQSIWLCLPGPRVAQSGRRSCSRNGSPLRPPHLGLNNLVKLDLCSAAVQSLDSTGFLIVSLRNQHQLALWEMREASLHTSAPSYSSIPLGTPQADPAVGIFIISNHFHYA